MSDSHTRPPSNCAGRHVMYTAVPATGRDALSASEAVADLAARTGGRTVERFDGGREIMRFGFHRNDGVSKSLMSYSESARLQRRGCELFRYGPVQVNAAVVLICRNEQRVPGRSLVRPFDQTEKGMCLFPRRR